MEIILTEDVVNVGKRGQVLRVADGFGRNYLIPRGLAVAATPGNLKMVEQQRIAQARKEVRLKEEAEVLAREFDKLHLVLSRKAGETGVLFGSVTSKDLSELLEKGGVHLDRRKILLEHPLKHIGNFSVEVRPHAEVKSELLVSVTVEKDDPVARVLERGQESDQIASQVEAEAAEFAAKQEEAASRAESGAGESSSAEE